MRGLFGRRRATPLSAALACAICCAMLASPRRAVACPVEPLLSDYVGNSDLIFTGKVVSLEEREAPTPDGESYQVTVAVVKPETVLKGKLDMEKTVEVSSFYYGPEEGDEAALAATTYLIFATVDDAPGKYSAANARDISDAAVGDAYTARVRDLLDILSLAEGEERQPQMLEWAVRCSEEAATRSDGIRELFALCGYPDPESDEVQPEINSSQRERLVAALQATEKAGWGGSFELVGFLARYRDARVTDCLVGWLQQEATEPTDDTRYVMYMVAGQIQWQTGQYLAERYPGDGQIEVRRKAVARFMELMQSREELPEALAAAEPEQSDTEVAEVYERESTIREAEERYEFSAEDEEPQEESPANDVVNTENPDEGSGWGP